jgi:hypothetical protein
VGVGGQISAGAYGQQQMPQDAAMTLARIERAD